MTVVTIWIDLAKNTVHSVDKNGNAVLVKPKLPEARYLNSLQFCLPVPSIWRPAQALITGVQ